MRFGKKSVRAISVALLATMASSVLPQSNVIAAAKGTFTSFISYTDVSVDTGERKTPTETEGEPETTDVPSQSEDAETAENEEAGAASISDANESNTSSSTGGNSSSYSSSSNYSSNYIADDSVTIDTEEENPLTAGNRVSEYITFDKSAIGFTKIGDVVSVTATLSDEIEDKIVWNVADPSILVIKSVEENDKTSTAEIEWIGGSGTTKFYAGLESNPDEYTEGTAMFFDSNTSSLGEESTDEEDKELKTEFESPEVEAFLQEMFNEGLTQENSDYDLSKFNLNADSTESAENTESEDESETEEQTEVEETVSSPSPLMQAQPYLEMLKDNELSSQKNQTNQENAAEKSDSQNTEVNAENNSENSTETEKTDRVSSYLNSTSQSDSNDTASQQVKEPETIEKVVTETVEETEIQNVSRETTTTTTVTTEIVDEKSETQTVTSTVEKEVPKEVVTYVEQQVEQEVEREVVNEDGEVETVTETVVDTISTPVVETVYETVTETVEEEVEGATTYTVRETTTTETTTTETVKSESGEIISAPTVVDTNSNTSTKDYETTSKPEVGTVTLTDVSTSEDTVEKITEKEVSKTVTEEVESSVSVEESTNDSSQVTATLTEIPGMEVTESTISQPEVTSVPTTESYDIAESYNVVNTSLSEQLSSVDVESISKKLSENYNVTAYSETTYSENSDTPPQITEGDVSKIEQGLFVELNQSETFNLQTLITKAFGTNLYPTDWQSMDNRVAKIEGDNLVTVSEGRTKIYGTCDGLPYVLNIDVHKKDIVTDEEGTEVVEVKDTVPMVVAGTNFSLALKNDGTVWGWGLNENRQLSNYNESYKDSPVQIQIKTGGKLKALDNITYIAVGAGHSLAVTKDGNVYAWGLNRNGQLGSGAGNKLTSANPTLVVTEDNSPLTGIKAVAAGNYFSYAIDNNGSVWGWGDNRFGQMGNGEYGSVQAPGETGYQTDLTFASPVMTSADGTQLTNIVSITASSSYAFAVDKNGKAYLWGENKEREFIADADEVILYPHEFEGISVSIGRATYLEASAGGAIVTSGESSGEAKNETENHLAILASADGKRSVYTFGSNNYGELGREEVSAVEAMDSSYFGGSQITSVKSGQKNTAVVTENGSIYVWGDNTSGQLGNDDAVTSWTSTPTEVLKGESENEVESNIYFTNASYMAFGGEHAVAVRDDGSVWSWGSSLVGQLGNFTSNVKEYSPVQTGDKINKSLIVDTLIIYDKDTGEEKRRWDSSELLPPYIYI